MRLYVFVFMLLVFNSVHSQEKTLHEITIFESIEDYEKGEGIYFEKLLTWKKSSHISLVVESEGKKTKVKCDDIWGFDMGGALFRITQRGKFARVMVQGELVYYENGAGHANMMRRGVSWVSAPPGESVFFLSEDMNSDLIPVPNASVSYIGGTPMYDSLKLKHPEHEDFYNCIETDVETHEFFTQVKSCVAEFLIAK